MPKNSSIDQLSSATVRQARSEAALVQRDLKKLRDSISGLNHAIKAPKITTPRTKTKRTIHAPSLLDDLGDFAAGETLGAFGLSSGTSSAAQSASRNLLTLALGQRIR